VTRKWRNITTNMNVKKRATCMRHKRQLKAGGKCRWGKNSSNDKCDEEWSAGLRSVSLCIGSYRSSEGALEVHGMWRQNKVQPGVERTSFTGYKLVAYCVETITSIGQRLILEPARSSTHTTHNSTHVDTIYKQGLSVEIFADTVR